MLGEHLRLNVSNPHFLNLSNHRDISAVRIIFVLVIHGSRFSGPITDRSNTIYIYIYNVLNLNNSISFS